MSFAHHAVTKDGQIVFKNTKDKCEKFFQALVTEEMKNQSVWKVQPAKNKKVGEEI